MSDLLVLGELCDNIILRTHSCEIHTSEQNNMHQTEDTYSGRVYSVDLIYDRYVQFTLLIYDLQIKKGAPI